jgi:hypothetical protein
LKGLDWSGVLNDEQVVRFKAELGKSRNLELGSKPAPRMQPSVSQNTISTRTTPVSVAGSHSTIIKLPFPAFTGIRSPVAVSAIPPPPLGGEYGVGLDEEEDDEMSTSDHEPVCKKAKFGHLGSDSMRFDDEGTGHLMVRMEADMLAESMATNGGSIQQSPAHLDHDMISDNGYLSPGRSPRDLASNSPRGSPQPPSRNSPAQSSPLKGGSDSPAVSESPVTEKRARRRTTINASKGSFLILIALAHDDDAPVAFKKIMLSGKSSTGCDGGNSFSKYAVLEGLNSFSFL